MTFYKCQVKKMTVNDDWLENKNKYINFINKSPYLSTIIYKNITDYFLELSIVKNLNIQTLIIENCDVILLDNIYSLPKIKNLEILDSHINAKGKLLNRFLSIMPNLELLTIQDLTTTSCPKTYGNSLIISKLFYNNNHKYLKKLYLINVCCGKKRKK